MKKILTLIPFSLALAAVSCNLDLYPQTGYNEGNIFIPKDTTTSQYTSATQMENLVKAFYSNGMKSNVVEEFNVLDWLFYSDVRADNCYNGDPTKPEIVAIEQNKIDGSNKNVERDWTYIQNAINTANQVICNIDRVQKLDPSMSQSQHDLLLAQADILKAYFVFRGSQLYGTIPVINAIPDAITADNVEEVYDSYYPFRPSKKEIYDQLVEMLEFAAQHAPDLQTDDKYVLSKTFAKGLLARVYAEKSDIQDWNKVAQWCAAVESDMGVSNSSASSLRASLCDHYGDMWSYDLTANTAARNTKESIFEVTWTAENGHWLAMMFHRNQFRPDNNWTWCKRFTPSRDLIAAYDAEGDTERKNVNILWDSCDWSYYYPSSNYAFAGKMETNATSLIFMRLAEIYLLHAEALTMTGNTAEALKYVNAVRQRAGIAELSGNYSQDQMLDKVLDERRLELVFEGHRFFDLARHDKIIDVHNTIWKGDSYFLQREPLDESTIILPVPTGVLDKNPNIEQNPGY